MKKSLIFAAIAATVLSFTACQKDETIVNPSNPDNPITNGPRVKSTSDLHNTDWNATITYAEFLGTMLGYDTSCMQGLENDTLVFGLNFDGTYAHFSFPDNVEAYAGDENGLAQIYGVSYEYAYDGATHTGYFNGVAEDANGNEVPAQLQFTYNDTTDVITFVLPMAYADDGTPVNITLNFERDE